MKKQILTHMLVLAFGCLFMAIPNYDVRVTDDTIDTQTTSGEVVVIVHDPIYESDNSNRVTHTPTPTIYIEESVSMSLVEEEESVSLSLVVEEDDPDILEEEGPMLSRSDIELLALLVMAEAEGESDEGKRLVVDTVLNRVDSEHFPDTIRDVIYQPGQFTSMWNGRVDRCHIDETMCDLVIEAYESRENLDVIFFNAGRYSKYGTPMMIVGDHYFSSY